MPFIADHAIPIIFLPQRPTLSEALVDLSRGETFPGLDHLLQAMRRAQAKEHMNVIRHHHKSHEIIAVAVEILKRPGDDSGQLRVSQNAGTFPGIKPLIDSI